MPSHARSAVALGAGACRPIGDPAPIQEHPTETVVPYLWRVAKTLALAFPCVPTHDLQIAVALHDTPDALNQSTPVFATDAAHASQLTAGPLEVQSCVRLVEMQGRCERLMCQIARALKGTVKALIPRRILRLNVLALNY
jgi:hypothetical protein